MDSSKISKLKNGLPKEITNLVKEKILAQRNRETELTLSLNYIRDDNSFRDKLLEFETYDPLVHLENF
jgi:hypothetical protein